MSLHLLLHVLFPLSSRTTNYLGFLLWFLLLLFVIACFSLPILFFIVAKRLLELFHATLVADILRFGPIFCKHLYIQASLLAAALALRIRHTDLAHVLLFGHRNSSVEAEATSRACGGLCLSRVPLVVTVWTLSLWKPRHYPDSASGAIL